MVCSVIHKTSLGSLRGCSGGRGDGRRQSERVASLRARWTELAADQSREETCICSLRRDRSPKSREIVRLCVSAAVQQEHRHRQQNRLQNSNSLSLGLSAS